MRFNQSFGVALNFFTNRESTIESVEKNSLVVLVSCGTNEDASRKCFGFFLGETSLCSWSRSELNCSSCCWSRIACSSISTLSPASTANAPRPYHPLQRECTFLMIDCIKMPELLATFLIIPLQFTMAGVYILDYRQGRYSLVLNGEFINNRYFT